MGFRAASSRARGKKLGVSARQLAGGGFPVDGNFNPLSGGIVLLYPCYIGGPPKPYITEGGGLTALDGPPDKPGGRLQFC